MTSHSKPAADGCFPSPSPGNLYSSSSEALLWGDNTMVSGLCHRADPRTLNLIEDACLCSPSSMASVGYLPLGSEEGLKAPLCTIMMKHLAPCTSPRFDTGEYFVKISRKYFTPSLYAFRGVQRELRNVCVISPVSWVYNKEFSILGTAGFICVWKAFGSSNLG